MKKKVLLLVMAISLGMVTYSQKAKAEKNWEKLDQLVEGKEFRIESTWARAMGDVSVNAIASSGLQQQGGSGNRFNLIGNFNYIEMRGEKLSAYLPFFGRRQFGNGHYADGGAIEFDGVPREFTIEKNEKKKRYDIYFVIDNETETFQVNMQLYTSLKSLVTVNSNQRFIIRYDGEVGELPVKGDVEGK